MAQDRRRQEAQRQEIFFFPHLIKERQLLELPFVKCFAGKYKDNEAIEFSFDLNKDVPEDVAQEMVRTIMRDGGPNSGRK